MMIVNNQMRAEIRRALHGTTALILAGMMLLTGNVPGIKAAEQPSAGQAESVQQVTPPGEAGADTAQPVDTAGAWPSPIEIFSDAAILMDADTGTVLFDKSMDTQMYPASVTKIMTILLALENGNLEDQVAMTDTATAYCTDGSSNLNTQVGEIFTLEQLLYGTMLKSANDMATQVGVHIGGTLENFIQMMNDRAASLGCTNTHFENACGMPSSGHMTTAHDLALIAQQDLKYDKFREIVNTANYTIPPTNMTAAERTMTNHNALLVVPEFYYPGVIGGKTGYTDAAQSCLTNFASREGMTLIVVSLHAMDGSYAAQDNIDLLDYGFNNFKLVDVGPAEFLTGGGKVMIPSGADVKDCRIEKTESVSAEGVPMVEQIYYLGDHRVGNTLMTKENAEAYEKQQKAEAEKKNRKKEKDKKGTDSSKAGIGSESDAANGTSVTPSDKSIQASSANAGDVSGEISGEKAEKSSAVKFIIGFIIFIIAFVAVMSAALAHARNKRRIRSRNRRRRRSSGNIRKK